MDLTNYYYKDVEQIYRDIENHQELYELGLDNPPSDYELKWASLTTDKGPLTIYPHPADFDLWAHCHDFFEFAYVYRGGCRMHIDSADIELKAGDMCLFNLQAKHSIDVDSSNENIIFNIIVKPEYFNSSYFRLACLPNNEYIFDFFLESMINQQIKDNYVLFKNSSDNTYQDLIEHIIHEHYEGKSHKEVLLNFLFSSMLIELSRTYGSNLDASSKEELKKYKITEITEYIFAHYKDITLKDLAAHFNYSCAYLSTVIKKYSGNSFSELLHAFRFLRACQLLTESDTSISDIIEDVGCSNQTWFIQNFKKRYGISPSEYRRRYLK